MQVLQTAHYYYFSLPKPLKPSFKCRHGHSRWRLVCPPATRIILEPPKSFGSEEFPVDEDFLEKFAPKEKETEDEARRRNWVERDWAPWEEILSPEADFARKAINEGVEVPLQNPETIEAFKMLTLKYREKRKKESGLTDFEWYRKQFEIKGEIPEKLETVWAAPLVVAHVAPRDWPPRGWEVDRKELEFIREGHWIIGEERLTLDHLNRSRGVKEGEEEEMCLDRYKVFLKQYKEWVAANKDRLEKESYLQDQDYYPGRRKRGKDYKEGMYELPFYYPGQICEGKVTCIALYQGAFVDIGGVHDGWVPIKGNDWYWIRHHIKVGMHVIVEILAKRDPYRFRFPIELRFVFPNIDHLTFNRFEFPPIFHREDDKNLDELRRDCGRPPVPRRDPGTKPEEEQLLTNHPYVDKLWQIHVAEQMILDDLEANPEKYKGKKLSELSDDDDYDEQNSVIHTQAYYKKTLLPKTILKTSVKELDLEAALAEREFHNKRRAEAKERGEKYKITHLRRNVEMDEYDLLHWRRSLEEREALIRDISCRQALGLPLEEPGSYKPESYFGKDQYDPQNPLYRYDYWGEPKNTEKSKLIRRADFHNKSIVGKGTVWDEISYDELIKRKMQREARSSEIEQKVKDSDKTDEDEDEDKDEDENEDDYDDDWDYSFLSDSSAADYSNQPIVNGAESAGLSDEGMFES